MKIGLYFGSFNPVHNGHMVIAGYMAEFTDLDQVWFVVSPQNPLKQPGSLLNEYQRLFLVNIAIEDNNSFKASDVEFKLPRPSYTIDTLTYLEEKYPEDNFSIIMGSDSFSNIYKWKNYEKITGNHKIIVYKRPGFNIEAATENVEVLKDVPLLEISATNIRNLLKSGKSAKYLLPDSVLDEIEKSRFYK